ncbi:hypothetical protein E3P91_03042 [Wallemia ichthyophaga]|nr:hypothetical protein E3P91_03042 [Wallemia ichthyophaga]TIB60900.1 hypothetical protein E3P78_02982 [Wallemia ichthyophaga]
MAHTHTRKLFNELYDSPAVTSAQLRPLGDSSSANHAYVAHLTQTQPHTQRQTKVKTQRTLLLNDSDESIHSTAAELVDVTDQAVDKHGNRQAILRTLNGSSGSDGKKTLYVDIYNLQSGHRTHSINVTTSHGLFCADPTFGRVRWSPCGRALVYTADRRKQSDGDDDAVSLFEKRRYVPSWGEQFPPTLQQPRVYYMDLDKADQLHTPDTPYLPVEVTADLPTHSLGQPQFGRSKKEVIFTAYANQHDESRLGIIYCQNRPSAIHAVDVDTRRTTQLSDASRSVRSPRCTTLSNGRHVVVFLSNELDGPHASNCRVECITTDGNPYGMGWSRINRHDTNDPGLYIDQLPYEPFLWDEVDGGNDALLATSILGSRKTVLRFELIGEDVQDISILADAQQSHTSRSSHSSLDCLAAFGSRAIISQSTFTAAQQILVCSGVGAHDAAQGQTKTLHRHTSRAFEQILSTLAVEFDARTKSWILYSPTGKTERGIILPHGGPHSSSVPMFSPALAALAAAGMTVVLPNYRGSTGYGGGYLRSLLGHVGEHDVTDCLAAMDMAERVYGVESGRWCAYGGSHGGFLAAHLTAQHPKRFAVAVMRNPVISLASNATQSDIPDWCFVESGLSGRGSVSGQAPSAEEYRRMDALSPLHQAASVTAPTLLLAGCDDQRVPNMQTRHWFHALKASRKIVDMLTFNRTGHPLDSVEAETAGFEATLQWFEEYFK